MSIEKTIATYKIVADAGGNCYKFYCDLSGALVCTTKPYKADNPEEELLLAWETKEKNSLTFATNAASRFQMQCSTLRLWNASSALP